MLPFIKAASNLVITVDGVPVLVPTDHPNMDAIKHAIRNDDGEAVLGLVEIAKAISTSIGQSSTNVTFVDGLVHYKGEALHNECTRRVVQLHNEGFGVESYLRFIDKLMKNQSYNSRQQLFTFLEDHLLPISEDGDILAYKGVTSAYKDLYTGRFDNSIGAKHEMDRADVDDNSATGCSKGFHAGSEEYALGYGDKTMVVKINPRDAVSVPTKETNKLRMCKYEVVAEYKKSLDKGCYTNEAEDAECIAPAYTELDDVDENKYSLFPGDEITFTYKGVFRHATITECKNGSFNMRLGWSDPSYGAFGDEFRCFLEDDIKNIHFKDPEDTDEDEDDEDTDW